MTSIGRQLMCHCLLLICTTACGDEPSAKATPKARATASVVTQGELWMGQRITIEVELATPGIFRSAPTFDLPKVAGVFLIAPEDRPVVGSETVDDVTFTTQRHELTVYSQHEGTVNVPGITVRFDSSAGFGQPTTEQRVTTPAISLSVKRPPGTEQFATVVASTNLSVKESWVPPLPKGPVALGSAFTRTITIEATDVPGMLLQTTTAATAPNLTAYPKAPRLEDTRDRGQLTGRRIEQTTYVCEQAGTGTLPAMSFAWWNPKAQQLHQTTLPAHAFEVAAGTGAETAIAPAPSAARHTRISLLPVACFLLMSLCGWIFKDKLARAIQQHQLRTAESESAYFARFVHACHDHDTAAVEQRLFEWLDQLYPLQSGSVVQEFLRDAGDPKLSAAMAKWDARLYGRTGDLPDDQSPRPLLALIRTARCRILTIRHRRHSTTASLPALNPTTA